MFTIYHILMIRTATQPNKNQMHKPPNASMFRPSLENSMHTMILL